MYLHVCADLPGQWLAPWRNQAIACMRSSFCRKLEQADEPKVKLLVISDAVTHMSRNCSDAGEVWSTVEQVAPNIYLTQRYSIVEWTLRYTLQWNFKKTRYFHSRKCFWKCHLRNGRHFVSGSMCLSIYVSLGFDVVILLSRRIRRDRAGLKWEVQTNWL